MGKLTARPLCTRWRGLPPRLSLHEHGYQNENLWLTQEVHRAHKEVRTNNDHPRNHAQSQRGWRPH